MTGQLFIGEMCVYDAGDTPAALEPGMLAALEEPRPTELYWANRPGTEFLGDDANFEVEFIGEYESIADALEAIEWTGRGYLSTPDRGRYTHRILSLQGSIGIYPI